MSWTAAIEDIDAALAWARSIGERRLELAALRARGGDAAVGAQLPADELLRSARGRRTARRRARRPAGRGRLREPADGPRGEPAATGRRQPARGAGARAGARRRGRRTGWCWRSTGSRPWPGTSATRPRWRPPSRSSSPSSGSAHDAWLLQWVVFESAFVPAAHDDWDEAAAAASRRPRAQPAQRLPGLRGLPPGVRGLAGAARRRPRRGTSPGPAAPSRRRQPSTTRGGTPGPPGCWPPPSWRPATTAEAEAVARAGLAALSGTARPGRLLCAVGAGRGHRRADPRRHRRARRGGLPARPAPGCWARTPTCCSRAPHARAATTPRRPGSLAPLREATAGSWPALRRRVEAVDGTPGQSTSSASRAARAAPSEGTGR